MEQRKISFDPEISPMVNIVSQGYSMNASMEEISRIESIADAIKKVLESSQVKGLIRCANEINLQDTAPYYFENIDRIFKIDYTPTDKDVIYSRSATTAISETSFKVGQRDLLLIDVGGTLNLIIGQKSLRLQWAPYFEQKLSCIIFVAAISSYDQVMAEDCTVNRMKDTLSLFKKISENKLLKDVAIIVFLNKTDLFKAKLETSPINLHFSEYTGDQQYKNARKFFRRRFEKITDSIVNESGGDSSRNVYYHDTTNTDPQLVSFVFKAVSDIVLNMNLKGINFAQDRDSYGGSSS